MRSGSQAALERNSWGYLMRFYAGVNACIDVRYAGWASPKESLNFICRRLGIL